MLWHQIAGHALLSLQTGVSAVAYQVIATTCVMLLSGKHGLQMHNYVINGGHTSLLLKPGKTFFSAFFLFFTIVQLC